MFRSNLYLRAVTTNILDVSATQKTEPSPTTLVGLRTLMNAELGPRQTMMMFLAFNIEVSASLAKKIPLSTSMALVLSKNAVMFLVEPRPTWYTRGRYLVKVIGFSRVASKMIIPELYPTILVKLRTKKAANKKLRIGVLTPLVFSFTLNASVVSPQHMIDLDPNQIAALWVITENKTSTFRLLDTSTRAASRMTVPE